MNYNYNHGVHPECKTTSGAPAVQIAYKQKSKIFKIIHISSAHSDENLKILLALAYKRLQHNQLPLFPKKQITLQVGIKPSFFDLLWKTLREQYHKLGFNSLDDEVIEALCLARFVEVNSTTAIRHCNYQFEGSIS